MAKKLFRKKRRMFSRRRKSPLKPILTVVCCLGLVAGGFFGARYLMEGLGTADPGSGTTSSPVSAGASAAPGASAPEASAPAASAPESVPPTTPSPSTGTITRGFYLPAATLKDAAALDAQLTAAAAAGFDAVLFDLKDEQGALHYASATPLAVAGGGITDDALTLDALKAAADLMREKGLTPVPRVYAFRDNIASKRLAAAKITHVDYPSYTWYDADPQAATARSWLNPYAPEAHDYIAGLVNELSDAGFAAVMLDGVQFPAQTKSAYYGSSEWRSMSEGEVLRKFVTDLVAAQPDMRIMLSAPGLAVFGNDTKVYGGNPITFGAPVISPVLIPSTLGSRITTAEETLDAPASHPYDAVRLAAGQVLQRIRLMAEDERPALLPMLDGAASTADVQAQLRALNEQMGDAAAFILYRADGRYDFAALAD